MLMSLDLAISLRRGQVFVVISLGLAISLRRRPIFVAVSLCLAISLRRGLVFTARLSLVQLFVIIDSQLFSILSLNFLQRFDGTSLFLSKIKRLPFLSTTSEFAFETGTGTSSSDSSQLVLPSSGGSMKMHAK